MPNHLIQILDSADPPRDALVLLEHHWVRGDDFYWQNKSPGAFLAPVDVPLSAKMRYPTNEEDYLDCFVMFKDGQIVNCFRLIDVSIWGTKFTNDSGEGLIFASGTQAMKAGKMTWKKL